MFEKRLRTYRAIGYAPEETLLDPVVEVRRICKWTRPMLQHYACYAEIYSPDVRAFVGPFVNGLPRDKLTFNFESTRRYLTQ